MGDAVCSRKLSSYISKEEGHPPPEIIFAGLLYAPPAVDGFNAVKVCHARIRLGSDKAVLVELSVLRCSLRMECLTSSAEMDRQRSTYFRVGVRCIDTESLAKSAARIPSRISNLSQQEPAAEAGGTLTLNRRSAARPARRHRGCGAHKTSGLGRCSAQDVDTRAMWQA